MSQKSEKTILLIDYENIHNIELTKIKQQDINIKIFVGQAQNKIPFDLVQAAQQFNNPVEWIKIEGSGSNALDFYIAFYLGQCFKDTKNGTFLVLSKDKGFDPLIKHINNGTINCQRIENLDNFSQKQELSSDTKHTKLISEVINKLAKIEKNKRPATQEALHNSLKSQLAKKKLQDKEIIILVKTLFLQNKITKDNNRLIYNF